MINCIYCAEVTFEEGQGSKEHAILSSLGGKKASRNICCQTCNKELGDEIDKVVSESFSLITNFLDVKTDRGTESKTKTIKNIGIMNGIELELKPGGVPHYSEAKLEISSIDKHSVRANISARSPQEATKLMESFAKKYGKSVDDLKDINISLNSNYDIPQVHGKIQLGGELFFRSIAKTMLTYLATLCKPLRLRDGSFDEIIDYIKVATISAHK